MNVAIVGSRGISRKAANLVATFVESLPIETVVVSGGASGVDTVAEQTARARGMQVKIIPANWAMGKTAGLIRNSKIVFHADRVVAFWDMKSRGTKDTIDKARRAGKEVEIIDVSEV